jgi:hypothetical protein
MSKPEDNTTMWQVAGGVLLAFAVMGLLRSCQQRAAIQQFNEQVQALSTDMATSMKRDQAAASRRASEAVAEAQRQEVAVAEATALPPGHRCMGKDLFRRVENGWVQVNDGSAQRICR